MSRTISYSQMSLFWQCPRKWHNQYIEEYERPKIPAFAFGSAVHNYIEHKLIGEQYYLNQDDLPYAKDLDNEIEKVITLGENGYKSLTEFTELGLSEILIDKENVELQFEIDVENGAFRGFIDLCFINKYGEHVIIDWKTTSKEYTEHDIKTSNQLTCYAFAYQKLFGILPNKVCYITLNKKTNESKLYYDSRNMDDIHNIEKQIIDTLYAMDRLTNCKNENSCIGQYGKCQFYNRCWNGNVGIVDESIELWKLT